MLFAFVLLDTFFSTTSRDWMGKNVSEMTYFVSSGMWNLNSDKYQHLLPNPNVLVAINKGMWAVNLSTYKILQFLTGVPANAGCPV